MKILGFTLQIKYSKVMDAKIQYHTDDTGKKTRVSVSIEEWKKRNARLRNLQTKLRVLTGIRDGLREVKAARKTGENLQKLSDFIHESRS